MPVAMVSTRSSLLPNFGYGPSISKSAARLFSSRMIFTFAYFIALNESATTESPAIPQAIVR